MPIKHYPAAAVMGRFQPLHNEHMNYLLAAVERCDHLWVGITRFLPSRSNHGDSHRGSLTENPLTFFERLTLIRDALLATGVTTSEFTCLPFPIDEPDQLPQCLPTSVPCLTTLCEPWNAKKMQLLQDCGYHVEVLYNNEARQITGQGIRDSIRRGDEAWKTLVPATVVESLSQWKIAERLRS